MISEKMAVVLKQSYKYGIGVPMPENLNLLDYLQIGGQHVIDIDEDEHRWWNTYTSIYRFRVSDEVSYLIGFQYAHANGDRSVWELGYEFDEDTIQFYEEVEKLVVTKVYNELSDDEVQI